MKLGNLTEYIKAPALVLATTALAGCGAIRQPELSPFGKPKENIDPNGEARRSHATALIRGLNNRITFAAEYGEPDEFGVNDRKGKYKVISEEPNANRSIGFALDEHLRPVRSLEIRTPHNTLLTEVRLMSEPSENFEIYDPKGEYPNHPALRCFGPAEWMQRFYINPHPADWICFDDNVYSPPFNLPASEAVRFLEIADRMTEISEKVDKNIHPTPQDCIPEEGCNLMPSLQ